MQTEPATASRKRSVVLVHDWLTGFRGGEQVLLSLARIFPEAPIYTLLHVKGSLPEEMERREIKSTFIGRLPLARRFYRHYLPLFPLAARTLDVRAFDLVISSSHCVAKSVVPGPQATHICYCHTPMRYVWDRFDDYFGPARLGALGSSLARGMAEGLRAWDVATAKRTHYYVANSRTVEGRIHYFYGLPSSVIEPPVDTDFFTIGSEDAPRNYDLVVSALVPYKRIDLAVESALATKRTLRIVGTGPEEARLRSIAANAANIEFLGARTREELRTLYRGARALVLPGVEDFGIVVAEALACGTPAVVFHQGGGAEIIENGQWGEVFAETTSHSVGAALERVDARSFSKLALRERARAFDRVRFEARFLDFVDTHATKTPLSLKNR